MNKEDLSRLIEIRSEIGLICRELDNIEIEYTKDAVRGSSVHFPYIEQTIKIEGYDYESYNRKTKKINNRLNCKLKELMETKDKITEYIYSLEDGELRQILMYKYINGLTWEKIGENMNYDESTVRKKHNKWLRD